MQEYIATASIVQVSLSGGASPTHHPDCTGGVPKDSHNVEFCAPPQRHQFDYQGLQRDFPGTCKKKKLGPIQLCTVCNMTIAARAHESKGIITKRMSWRS